MHRTQSNECSRRHFNTSPLQVRFSVSGDIGASDVQGHACKQDIVYQWDLFLQNTLIDKQGSTPSVFQIGNTGEEPTAFAWSLFSAVFHQQADNKWGEAGRKTSGPLRLIWSSAHFLSCRFQALWEKVKDQINGAVTHESVGVCDERDIFGQNTKPVLLHLLMFQGKSFIPQNVENTRLMSVGVSASRRNYGGLNRF